ncbi:unnamed protein product [Toxocara canis]|uniref:Glyco_trans_4-like_N domain-containing protein n=1 Tax=Toxocara canis TaxID=6265 RepID=A0A183UT67_TOXCA|nr:unnamed protein product [Toxocara canis]
MFSLLKRLLLLFLYVIGIFICVPLSLFVWWIRRKFFDEKSVAGDRKVIPLHLKHILFTPTAYPHQPPVAAVTVFHNCCRQRYGAAPFCGARMLVVIVHPEQWNGGSDRCTIGMIKHFVSAGHRVVWYTTMIDDYWQNENFGGVGEL